MQLFGKKPNQIPTNADLGGMAYQDPKAVTLTGNLTVPSINGGQFAGHRNKIINGAFSINQRGYASGGATTAGQYTLDRWKVSGTGGVTFSTSANKTTVTIPAGQTLQQVIEGLTLQSGVYVLSWEGTAQGRIGNGAYGTSGSVVASVTGGTNTTIQFNAGTVALVQLEMGEIATPFEHRHCSVELVMCQRYFYSSNATKNTVVNCYAFIGVNTTFAAGSVRFPVEMRTAPAVTLYSTTSGVANTVRWNSANIPVTTLTGIGSGGFYELTATSGGAANLPCIFQLDASAEL